MAQLLFLSSGFGLRSKAEGQVTTRRMLNTDLLGCKIGESTAAQLITVNRKTEEQIIQVKINGLAVRNTVTLPLQPKPTSPCKRSRSASPSPYSQA